MKSGRIMEISVKITFLVKKVQVSVRFAAVFTV